MNRSYEPRTLKQIIKLIDRGMKSSRKPSFKLALYVMAVLAIMGSYILVARRVLLGEWGVLFRLSVGCLQEWQVNSVSR